VGVGCRLKFHRHTVPPLGAGVLRILWEGGIEDAKKRGLFFACASYDKAEMAFPRKFRETNPARDATSKPQSIGQRGSNAGCVAYSLGSVRDSAHHDLIITE
jgi:hypothetical protein